MVGNSALLLIIAFFLRRHPQRRPWAYHAVDTASGLGTANSLREPSGDNMMAAETKNPSSALPAQSSQTAAEPGPFVLRTLLQDVPLSADGGNEDIKINCVDYLGTCLHGARLIYHEANQACAWQTETFMSALQLQSCCTLSRYHQIPPKNLRIRSSS